MLTVDPGVTNDNRPFWELQLGDFGLYVFVLQGDPFDLDNLLAVSISVLIRSEADIRFHTLPLQVDHGLEKLVLVCSASTSFWLS